MSCSKVVDATDADTEGISLGEEDSRGFIPVRAYFLGLAANQDLEIE